MNYVFHLGATESACRFLHETLADDLDALRAQGVFFVDAEMPDIPHQRRAAIRALCHPDGIAPTGPDLAALNAEITRAAGAAAARTVLTLGQDGLGPAMHAALSWGVGNPGFFPRATTCFKHLTAGLPRDRLRIVLHAASPESYLLDLYSDAIRGGHTDLALGDFCRAVNFNSIDFHGLGQRLAAMDPAMDIRVRSAETATPGPASVLRDLLTDAGADPAGLACATGRVEQRLDANQVEALRQISTRGQSKRWRLVARLRQQVLAHDPDPAHRLDLPEWVRDSLAITFRARDMSAA